MRAVRLGLCLLSAALVSTACAGSPIAETAPIVQPTGVETTGGAPATAPPTTTSTATPSPKAVEAVRLVCGVPGVTDFEVHTVPLAPDGTADFEDLWVLNLTCDQGYGDGGVTERQAVVTPLQQAVVEVSRSVGYMGAETSDSEILYSVYGFCGTNDPDDSYVTLEDYSESQVAELRVWMILCPNHPQATRWKEGITASVKAQEAEASGARVYDGTYEVPSQMRRGTFVVNDVTNCYWETRNAEGRIIDNDFVIAAPRVVANLTAEAVVFTASGCGQWNLQE